MNASFEPVERTAKMWLRDVRWANCWLEQDIMNRLPLVRRPQLRRKRVPKEGVPSVEAIVNGLVGMSAGDRGRSDFPRLWCGSPPRKDCRYHLCWGGSRKDSSWYGRSFLQGLGVDDETLAEGIRQNLEQRKATGYFYASSSDLRGLQSRSEFPVPESIHEQETQEVLQELVNINHRQGITEDQLEDNKDQLHSCSRKCLQRISSDISCFNLQTKLVSKEYILLSWTKLCVNRWRLKIS